MTDMKVCTLTERIIPEIKDQTQGMITSMKDQETMDPPQGMGMMNITGLKNQHLQKCSAMIHTDRSIQKRTKKS